MEPLREKLTRILSRLAGGKAHLKVLSNGHVSGHVVSSEFEECDYEDRRRRIRALIDEAILAGELSQHEALGISTLLTYTPEEWAVNPVEQ